jgi:chemotaxis protein histidine kinase CheA
MKTNEKLTIQTANDLFIFIEGVDNADHHARQHAYFTEQAKLAITALQMQYVDIQALSDNTPAKAGILPKEITRAVITQLWNIKLDDMLASDTKPTPDNVAQKQENHLDHWFKVVKAGILYGMPHTQSIKILQEGLIKQYDNLVKKLAAEKAKAEKAEKEAQAAQAKAAQEAQKAQEAQAALDFDAVIEAAQKGKEAQAQAQEAQEEAQEAQEKIESTEKAIEKIEQKIKTTQKQATKKQAAKEASAAISVENTPTPDLSNVGFSVDCKTRMTEMLDDLESEFSHAELLCLAGLIRARYTPSKA